MGRIGVRGRVILPAMLAVLLGVVALEVSTLDDIASAQAARVDADLRRAMALLRRHVEALGPVAVQDGALSAGGTQLAARGDLVDDVTLGTGAVATIFAGETRIATTVRGPDGAPAVGTRLAAGAAFDAVIRRGERYVGENVILGVAHRTLYEPLRDAAGRQVGVLFVGVRLDEMAAQIAARRHASMLGACVVAGLVGVVLLLWMRLALRPLVRLADLMDRINRIYREQVRATPRSRR